MGADRGIHVVLNDKEYEGLQPLAVAKLFAKITEQEKPSLIILGKQVQVKTEVTLQCLIERTTSTLTMDHAVERLFHVHHELVFKGCNKNLLFYGLVRSLYVDLPKAYY